MKVVISRCSRLSTTVPTDSSDWRRSRASEDGVSRSHGDMGAAPDARSSDFRVPVDVKRDDGLREGAEKSSETTDARRGSKEPDNTVPAHRGD
ncbi:hypothetical protein NDU88_003218 [Pleurodeles waltl]|uniref:Uncharacterized protein n=1 Tax=Pleurodeles waltl TaxID=8319 RepID=A0AAV7MTM4_PLEWA|nr:hypothetical protein NDU88_003218 [Pleurodeles waltl]